MRASAGSVFRLPTLASSEAKCFEHLHAAGVRTLATSSHEAQPLGNHDLSGPVAIVIGAEGSGLSPELTARCDASIAIPCPGPVESLNAAVAASILLYESLATEAIRMSSLFDIEPTPESTSRRSRSAPLAERMRPRNLAEYAGQEHLIGPGKPLRVQIEHDDPSSMIFWGPPGVGRPRSPKSSPKPRRPPSSNSPPS